MSDNAVIKYVESLGIIKMVKAVLLNNGLMEKLMDMQNIKSNNINNLISIIPTYMVDRINK